MTIPPGVSSPPGRRVWRRSMTTADTLPRKIAQLRNRGISPSLCARNGFARLHSSPILKAARRARPRTWKIGPSAATGDRVGGHLVEPIVGGNPRLAGRTGFGQSVRLGTLTTNARPETLLPRLRPARSVHDLELARGRFVDSESECAVSVRQRTILANRSASARPRPDRLLPWRWPPERE